MAITSHQNEQNQTKMVILNHKKIVITGSCPSLGWPFAFKQMVESFPNPASDLDLGSHSIQINWREFPGWVDKGWIWKGPWCLSSVAGGQSVWGSTMVSLASQFWLARSRDKCFTKLCAPNFVLWGEKCNVYWQDTLYPGPGYQGKWRCKLLLWFQSMFTIYTAMSIFYTKVAGNRCGKSK